MSAEVEHAAEHAPTGSEYIVHHLQNLRHGEGFWAVNVDSIFFSVLLGSCSSSRSGSPLAR